MFRWDASSIKHDCHMTVMRQSSPAAPDGVCAVGELVAGSKISAGIACNPVIFHSLRRVLVVHWYRCHQASSGVVYDESWVYGPCDCPA